MTYPIPYPFDEETHNDQLEIAAFLVHLYREQRDSEELIKRLLLRKPLNLRSHRRSWEIQFRTTYVQEIDMWLKEKEILISIQNLVEKAMQMSEEELRKRKLIPE